MIGRSAELPARCRGGDASGAVGCRRAADRRIGYGQGAAGGAHPSREPVCVTPVRQGELRRHSDRADRERAVRSRKGRVHRRGRRSGAAGSSWPMAAASSWTKWATCTRRRRPSSFACCRTESFSGSAANSRFGSPSVSSPRRTAVSRSSSPTAGSDRTCTTGSASCPSACPRCASDCRTCRELVGVLPRRVLRAKQLPSKDDGRGRAADPRALRLAGQRP